MDLQNKTHGISVVVSLLLFSSILCLPATYAQLLSLRYYTLQDGLIAGEVNTIFQDSRGFIWIGTGEGLSMYDGNSFTNYTSVDGLAQNFVNCIIESKATPGTLFVGTHGGGISRIDTRKDHEHSGPRFTTIQIDSGLFSRRVSSIVEDTTGRLWVATAGGIYTVRDTASRLLIAYPNGSHYNLSDSPAGDILFALERALYRINPTTLEFDTLFVDLAAGDYITDLFADADGDLWLATMQKLLLHYEDMRLVTTRRIPSDRVYDMVDDSENVLLLSTNTGLLVLDKSDTTGAAITRFSKVNGLLGDVVTHVLRDREGNLWIGDFRKGVAKWADRNLYRFPMQIGHKYNNSSSAVDANGHVWVAAEDGLREIWMEHRQRWLQHTHTLREGQRSMTPHSLHVDFRGRLWVDTRNHGVVCYEVQPRAGAASRLVKIKEVRSPEILPTAPGHCFILDRSEHLWYSIQGIGVLVVDVRNTPRVVGHYTPANGLPGLSVRVIFQDSKDNVWLAGFDGGVVLVPHARAGPLQQPSISLPEGGVRSITEDRQGRLWLGTRYGGVIVLAGDSTVSLTMEKGLISNAIWNQCVDAAGDVWLGTQRGLQRIDGQSLKPEVPRTEFMAGLVVGCGISPIFQWFTSRDGLSIVGADHEARAYPPPPIHIRSFEVNSRQIPIDGLHEFDYDENNCTIEFVGLNFRDEDAVRYFYRLLGAENEWQGPVHRNSVTYASLGPGSYSFEVKAVSGEGMSSEMPARLSFTITQPYWERWWFRVGVILSIAGLLGRAVHRRFSALRRETHRQQELSGKLIEIQEAERKRIATELHDGLGQTLILIQHGIQHGLLRAPSDDGVKEELQKVARVAADAMNEAREISSNLHPHVLDKLGLSKAVSSMVHRVSQASGINIRLAMDDLEGTVPREHEIHLYRIVQESLNNIIKHSGASEADVLFSRSTNALTVTIADNGNGLPEPKAIASYESGGLGLAGIAERARILGGSLERQTATGGGVSLSIRIPIENHHEEI